MSKRKGETWYDCGYREAVEGLNCDAPETRGHRSYTDYVAGYADGETFNEREAYRQRPNQTEDEE